MSVENHVYVSKKRSNRLDWVSGRIRGRKWAEQIADGWELEVIARRITPDKSTELTDVAAFLGVSIEYLIRGELPPAVYLMPGFAEGFVQGVRDFYESIFFLSEEDDSARCES